MNIFDQPDVDKILGTMVEPVTLLDPSPGHSVKAAREDHRHKLELGAIAGIGQGRTNLLDNSGFLISQRTLPVSSGGIGVDRWKCLTAGTAVYSQDKSTASPESSLIASGLYTVSTADASIASGDYSTIQQEVEGLIVAALGYGSISAKTTTLSFWARSSVAGTYCASIRNSSGTRAYLSQYELAANTWKRVSIVIPGCTDGTWVITEASSALIIFSLAVGSSFQGAANAWQASNVFATSNQVNHSATLGNTFNITAVKWEIGNLTSNYSYEDYSLEYARCRRYLQGYYDPPLRGMVASASVGVRMAMTFTSPMRTAPTFLGATGACFGYDGVTGQQVSSIAASYLNANSAEHDINFIGAGWTARSAVGIYNNGNTSYWLYSAEI